MFSPYDTAGMPRMILRDNKIELVRNIVLANDANARSNRGDVPDSAASGYSFGHSAHLNDGFY
jgi:hypothetical protein